MVKRYRVTLTRTIEHVAVLEVEARNRDQAIGKASVMADEPERFAWKDGDTIGERSKAVIITDAPEVAAAIADAADVMPAVKP
jgi:hypothetical protein